MRISDWSSDVCSSDLAEVPGAGKLLFRARELAQPEIDLAQQPPSLRTLRIGLHDIFQVDHGRGEIAVRKALLCRLQQRLGPLLRRLIAGGTQQRRQADGDKRPAR